MYESDAAGGAEPRQRRYSSDWGSVSLSRGGSRAASPHGPTPEHTSAIPPFKSHSSDDIGSSWMRTVDSVNSGAQSVASDWAEYECEDCGNLSLLMTNKWRPHAYDPQRSEGCSANHTKGSSLDNVSTLDDFAPSPCAFSSSTIF